MIEGVSPVLQGLLGTCFTWGLTALGASAVFLVPRRMSESRQRAILDCALGFAAGVMIAASYWSLLAPAIVYAKESGLYGAEGQFAWLPVSAGFIGGALFVLAAGACLPKDPTAALSEAEAILDNTLSASRSPLPNDKPEKQLAESEAAIERGGLGSSSSLTSLDSEEGEGAEEEQREALVKAMGGSGAVRRRVSNAVFRSCKPADAEVDSMRSKQDAIAEAKRKHKTWRRILLLVLAVTIHNFPEGLAVGVGFGSIGRHSGATFQAARNLAVGIGLQNFPEGLAVSLPLLRLGYSPLKSFWWGQLSGMVEPVGGLLGAGAVTLVEPILPFALAFAAGAMIYVVVSDLIPEAHEAGNAQLASWGAIAGFVVMMAMDVGLGA